MRDHHELMRIGADTTYRWTGWSSGPVKLYVEAHRRNRQALTGLPAKPRFRGALASRRRGPQSLRALRPQGGRQQLHDVRDPDLLVVPPMASRPSRYRPGSSGSAVGAFRHRFVDRLPAHRDRVLVENLRAAPPSRSSGSPGVALELQQLDSGIARSTALGSSITPTPRLR